MFRALLATVVLACLGACASPAKVEFRAASMNSTPDSVKMVAPAGAAPIYVAPQVVISNSDIATASIGTTENGTRAVYVTLTDAGASKLLAYTSVHLREPIAIMIDGQLVSAPMVQSPLSKVAMILGGPNGFTEEEASRLVTSLNGPRSDA